MEKVLVISYCAMAGHRWSVFVEEPYQNYDGEVMEYKFVSNHTVKMTSDSDFDERRILNLVQRKYPEAAIVWKGDYENDPMD